MTKKKPKKKATAETPEPQEDPKKPEAGGEIGQESPFAALVPRDLDAGWLINCSLVTALAAFLRFFWIELKPLHHDEGVNGHFLTRLFRDDFYQYDPSNYHGPDLYYISLAFTKLFGLNTSSVRWSVAIFGLLTVVLALFLRRWIGKTGSLAAALFLAISPGMVYISRYFIHEIIFVFLSLSLVISVLYFIEKRGVGVFGALWMALLLMICFIPPAIRVPPMLVAEDSSWLWALRIGIFAVEAFLVFMVMRMLLYWNRGRPIYLMLASASLILLFATKETAFITVGTMLIAVVCVRLWEKFTMSDFFASGRKTILAVTGIALWAAPAALIAVFFSEVKEFVFDLEEFFSGPAGPDQSTIFYAIIALAIAGGIGWTYFVSYEMLHGTQNDEVSDLEKHDPSWKGFTAAMAGGLDRALVLAACVFVFIYIGVLFFSSFFSYPGGVLGAFEAYAIWTKTGSEDHTQNGMAAYVRWLLEVEAPVLILSILGTVAAMVRAKHRVAMFTALWAFGLLAAYTIIPYKTPWLALSFTLPMCIAAGYGIGRLAGSKDAIKKGLALVLTVLSAGVLLYQTYDLNFERYDDDRMPYVYAHTRRGFHDLIKEVERIADRSPAKMNAKIEIVTPDYWPMPWYLNSYPNALFHGNLVDAPDADVVIASRAQAAELPSRYGSTHRFSGEYPLRPGVELYILVRNDLAGPDAKGLAEIGGG